MKKITKLLFILFLVIIFLFSSQSKSDSSIISDNILIWLGIITKNDLTYLTENYFFFHNFIRKTAHFSLYFCLGAVGTKLNKKLLIFSIFVPFLDEYLQSFNLGRNSNFFDIFIDLLGLFTGFLSIQKGKKLIDKISDYIHLESNNDF
ncbi:VanZ family protein [Fusobacteria bacterium ZRK30]|nr:VanZ family protein [Fusobacteria bacterium ZRK30]